MHYIQAEFYAVVMTSGNLRKKAMWILLGADIQTEEIALLLGMHMIGTLQNVNWKYLDSQSLNNLPRANKSSNQRIKTIQDLYVTIRITCQDFLPANWAGGKGGSNFFICSIKKLPSFDTDSGTWQFESLKLSLPKAISCKLSPILCPSFLIFKKTKDCLRSNKWL